MFMTQAITISLDLQAFYNHRFFVRRRRIADKIFLVHLSRLFEIDELSNCIWLHCDGTKSALQIARAVADSFADRERAEIGIITLHNLQFFLDNELITALPRKGLSYESSSGISGSS